MDASETARHALIACRQWREFWAMAQERHPNDVIRIRIQMVLCENT